jgi:hypothetical protein
MPYSPSHQVEARAQEKSELNLAAGEIGHQTLLDFQSNAAKLNLDAVFKRRVHHSRNPSNIVIDMGIDDEDTSPPGITNTFPLSGSSASGSSSSHLNSVPLKPDR